MKIILLSALLLTSGIALLPQASAECEPGLDLDYCSGIVTETVDELVPDRCDWTDHGIVCRET